MKLFAGIIIGIVVTLAVLAIAGYAAITGGMIPAAADGPMLPGEVWAAHQDLRAVLQREATATSPIPADEENLLAGVKVYAANCGGCHGTPADRAPAFAQGFMPVPTLFAGGADVTDDPEGWTYWKVKHGIKWTGMPAFKTMLNEKQMWQVALFLKHQTSLPPKVQEYWNGLK